jgi:hypothetical protein
MKNVKQLPQDYTTSKYWLWSSAMGWIVPPKFIFW